MAAPMLHASPPEVDFDPSVLHVPGAFAWWYADLVTPQGDGLVLIWAFGLPFFPGSRAQLVAPRERPSLNVVAYKKGRPAFFHLEELGADEVEYDPAAGTWRLGRSHIRRTIQDGAVQLEALLDCRGPGTSRLAGRVLIEGPVRRPSVVEAIPEGLVDHDWSIVSAGARGLATLEVSGAPLHLDGRAYHDRNGGSRPLWELGIDRWLWGRLPFASGERVYYLLYPEQQDQPVQALGLHVDETGATTVSRLQAKLTEDRLSRWGLRIPRALSLRDEDGRLFADVHEVARPENGPFYARSVVQAEAPGEAPVLGIAEAVAPGRIDLPAFRPLVRMRAQTKQRPSPFLPLLAGVGPLSFLAAGGSRL